jgi:hypothetical protein
MKLTEAKLKQLILEAYLEDLMKPEEVSPRGKIKWPPMPPVDLVDEPTSRGWKQPSSAKQIKRAGIFKKRPLESFHAAVSRIVDEFSDYYPVGENGKKTRKSSDLNYGKGKTRVLKKPERDADGNLVSTSTLEIREHENILIKSNSATYRVMVKHNLPGAYPDSIIFRLTDYQALEEGQELNIFLARIREQIKSYIKTNNWDADL